MSGPEGGRRQQEAGGDGAGFRSGFVAVAGRPNMGKSTFLNRVLGEKVAIVSPKPQTTRNRILGVLHRPGCQMVLVDTPGIMENKGSLLHRGMTRTAYQACGDAEVVLYLVEAWRGAVDEDWRILATLASGRAPVVLVFNKMDRMDSVQLLPVLSAAGAEVARRGIGIAAMVPVSALKGDNLERLLTVVTAQLPVGPRYFPEDQVTDQPERFWASEIVRERLFHHLQQELPYALAVRMEQFAEEEGLIRMAATILVARESHKGMVIGARGEVLKRVGTEARRELEFRLGIRVFLQLWVKVRPGWQEDAGMLSELGYLVPE